MVYEIQNEYGPTISAKLPDEEAHMVAVEENTGFAFIVEERAEVDSAYYMPASLELLLKSFLYLFSCIFEICNLVLDHLNIDVFCYLQCVVFHLDLHVAEFDIS